MISRRFAAILSVALCGTVVSGIVAIAQTSPKSQLVRDAYPRLSSGTLASAKLAILPGGTLMRSGDVTITQKELDAMIAEAPSEKRAQLKNNAFFLLENQATRVLLVAEAKGWAKQTGRQPDENENTLMRAYFEHVTSKVDVSDDDLKAFYDSNKDMMGGATFDGVKDQLKEYLLDEKRGDAVVAHANTISERMPVEVSKVFAMRQYPLAMNNPVDKARKSGKPTMVEFGSDGCKPCEMMAPIVDALKKEYAGKVNIVFVHVGEEQILAARYGIDSIPVQAFYDKDGKEVFRHVGFFPKDRIVAKLVEMGVK